MTSGQQEQPLECMRTRSTPPDWLLEMAVGHTPTDAGAAHLESCRYCHAELQRLRQRWEGVTDAAGDELVPQERTRQLTTRMLHRVRIQQRASHQRFVTEQPGGELRVRGTVLLSVASQTAREALRAAPSGGLRLLAVNLAEDQLWLEVAAQYGMSWPQQGQQLAATVRRKLDYQVGDLGVDVSIHIAELEQPSGHTIE